MEQFGFDDLRRRIAAVFSDPVRYEASVHDNIAVGDVNGGQEEAVRTAARRAGLDEVVRRLPRGYATQFCHLFSDVPGARGVELSCGQWQRLALASHRPSTVAAADRVGVLDGGRVVAEGRPEAVMHPLLGQAAPTPAPARPADGAVSRVEP